MDISNFKVVIGDEIINIENLDSLYDTLIKYMKGVEFYG